MKDLMKMNVSELDSEALKATNGGVSWGIFGVTAVVFRLVRELNELLGNDGPGSEVQ
ncbi:MAG TPA: hypothetical protein PLR06_12390 [Cyclobacteriaceae bacterium]|nr:hypothetical protein [Cyclobacteriaceae bacterium]